MLGRVLGKVTWASKWHGVSCQWWERPPHWAGQKLSTVGPGLASVGWTRGIDAGGLPAVGSRAGSIETSPPLCSFPHNTLFSAEAFHSSTPSLSEQPGAELGAGDSSMSKTDKNPALPNLTFQGSAVRWNSLQGWNVLELRCPNW